MVNMVQGKTVNRAKQGAADLVSIRRTLKSVAKKRAQFRGIDEYRNIALYKESYERRFQFSVSRGTKAPRRAKVDREGNTEK